MDFDQSDARERHPAPLRGDPLSESYYMQTPNLASAALKNFLGRHSNTTLYSSPAITAKPTWAAPMNPKEGPLPPINKITYATIGVFDNAGKNPTYYDEKAGKTRKRQVAVRYKVAIEIWTKPAEEIQKHRGGEFKRQIPMRSANEFITKIVAVNLDQGNFTDKQATRMCEIAAENPNDLFGVINDRTQGFRYFPDQIVHLSFTEGYKPKVHIYNENETLVADRMTDTFLTERQQDMGLLVEQFIDRCGYASYRANRTSSKDA